LLDRLKSSQKLKFSGYEIPILIAIITVAVIVRFWDIGGVGFNNDEAVYAGQAANLAGYEEFSKYFSVIRAHPLLYHASVAVVYLFTGVSDVGARMVSATFGVATVVITYFAGKTLFNRKVGLLAAGILALLPYHVIVTKQAMVDVPFSFFFTLTVLFMAKYVKTNNRLWMYGLGPIAGLSFMSKEVGVLVFIAVLIYLKLYKKLGVKKFVIIVLTFLIVISPHIMLIMSKGDSTSTGSSYLEWQFSRPPNHPPDFYFVTLFGAMGILAPLSFLAIYRAIKTREQSGLLLFIFLVTSFVFFQLWPTKGFHYLVPLIPSFVLLGSSFFFTDWMKKVPNHKMLAIVLIPIIFLSTSQSIDFLFPPEEKTYLAGSGGLPNAREASLWIKQNTPEDSVIMVIGPTMGNIINFYSNRDTLALSVNPNPALRNPAYTPILDPDGSIQSGEIDYLVYDVYSAKRSRYFGDEMNYYVRTHNAESVYTEYEILGSGNNIEKKSVVIVYSVSRSDNQN